MDMTKSILSAMSHTCQFTCLTLFSDEFKDIGAIHFCDNIAFVNNAQALQVQAHVQADKWNSGDSYRNKFVNDVSKR